MMVWGKPIFSATLTRITSDNARPFAELIVCEQLPKLSQAAWLEPDLTPSPHECRRPAPHEWIACNVKKGAVYGSSDGHV